MEDLSYQTAYQIINDAIFNKSSSLDLGNLGLNEIPSIIKQLATSLRSLNLAQNNFEKFPIDQLLVLEQLEKIDISDNSLKDLPSDIRLFKNLKSLILKNNSLSSLPNELEELIRLNEINIDKNEFFQFPLEVVNLESLVGLSIRDNKLTAISSNIKGVRIKTLDLANNNLKTLPEAIGNFSRLEFLDISHNQIEVLPEGMGNLVMLSILDLTGNAISSLPRSFRNLKNLRSFQLRGNPIQLPPEILSKYKDPKAILEYYFSNLKSPLNECKILVVGQGSVGKTSLVQRILHNTFDPSQTKTDGISINQWQVGGNSKLEVRNRGKSESQITNPDSPIKLNIWDFGGQEIMHATHQFFLTKRSLYLLVLDARVTQEENRVEYWLKIIQSFSGESPVLIVGNKTDQHPLDIDRTGLQKKYPNIVGILETSATTGAGIEALKTEIAKQVDTLPHIRDLLPETWFTVKSKLEELGREKNFIAQDEYLSLCGTNEITDETSRHALIRLLHDLGVVLHFQDDPRLEALGILNPQWVTNGVYKILNSHELFQNQGTLTIPILNKTLIPPEYPSNKRFFIVDMMKKFELCYDIEPDKSFLIPDLLPKDEPYIDEWDGALAFQYHYNVLPTSIISRFIVRMNAFVHKTIWRSGVVLKSGGNTVLIKADTEDRKIYILVNGDQNTRRDFLSAIRMEFDTIHKTIARIEANEKVPHPAYPNLVLDYSELIEFERRGISEFPKKVDSEVVICNVQ